MNEAKQYTVKKRNGGPLGPMWDVIAPGGQCTCSCGGGAPGSARKRALQHAKEANEILAKRAAESVKAE